MAGLVCEGCHDKVPQLGGFVHRNVLSHSSGGQKYEVEVSAGLVPPAYWEDLFWPPGLVEGPLLSVSLQIVFPLYVPLQPQNPFL